MSPTDTTNALRALLDEVAGTDCDQGDGWHYTLDSVQVEELAQRLATAQPDDPLLDCTDFAHPAYWRGYDKGVAHGKELASRDAQPEAKGVDDAADAALWRKHKDSFAVLQAMLDAASPLVLNKLKAQEATRQAQDTDGKIIAELHAEIARLRHLLDGRAYKTPVSGYDPTDMHKESANVDMRQAQGGGEDGR